MKRKRDNEEPYKNAKIVDEVETETAKCHFCGGEGLELGVGSDGRRMYIPCPNCGGLGTVAVTRKRKSVVTPDGCKAQI